MISRSTRRAAAGNDRRGAADNRLLLRWGALLVCAIGLWLVWGPSWRQHPQVTSRESLYYMKLLYTSCNTRDAEKLEAVDNGVQALIAEEKLTPAEQKSFQRIIQLARQEKWDAAARMSLQFAKDQVR